MDIRDRPDGLFLTAWMVPGPAFGMIASGRKVVAVFVPD